LREQSSPVIRFLQLLGERLLDPPADQRDAHVDGPVDRPNGSVAIGQELVGPLRDDAIRERMLGWQERFPQVGDVRGLGAMLAIELVGDAASKAPDPDSAKAVIDAALERGLILLKAGTYGNCIRVLCPLTIEDAVLDEALGVWEEALEATLSA
jgi:hypothetical protein